jgi:hypothetical protein
VNVGKVYGFFVIQLKVGIFSIIFMKIIEISVYIKYIAKYDQRMRSRCTQDSSYILNVSGY